MSSGRRVGERRANFSCSKRLVSSQTFRGPERPRRSPPVSVTVPVRIKADLICQRPTDRHNRRQRFGKLVTRMGARCCRPGEGNDSAKWSRPRPRPIDDITAHRRGRRGKRDDAEDSKPGIIGGIIHLRHQQRGCPSRSNADDASKDVPVYVTAPSNEAEPKFIMAASAAEFAAKRRDHSALRARRITVRFMFRSPW